MSLILDRCPFYEEATTDPFAPRLPLLGVRALVKNQLRITIDGGRKEVSLEHD
jgi:hypothetical protein